MQAVRIQRKRTPGFNLQEVSKKINGLPAKSCCRPHKYGNPFQISNSVQPFSNYDGIPHTFCNTIDEILKNYEWWIENTSEGRMRMRDAKEELKGHNLACFCKLEDKCHVDILLKNINS